MYKEGMRLTDIEFGEYWRHSIGITIHQVWVLGILLYSTNFYVVIRVESPFVHVSSANQESPSIHFIVLVHGGRHSIFNIRCKSGI